tara:strand:+ start:489 stop:617 length:129 start_codon:yes stop_codon:yes gene_type:complete
MDLQTRNSDSGKANPMAQQELLQQRGSFLGIQAKSGRKLGYL